MAEVEKIRSPRRRLAHLPSVPDLKTVRFCGSPESSRLARPRDLAPHLSRGTVDPQRGTTALAASSLDRATAGSSTPIAWTNSLLSSGRYPRKVKYFTRFLAVTESAY